MRARRWAVRGVLAPAVLVLALVVALLVEDASGTALASTARHTTIGAYAAGPPPRPVPSREGTGDPCGAAATSASPPRRSQAVGPTRRIPTRRIRTKRRPTPMPSPGAAPDVVTCVPAVAFQVRAVVVRGRIRTAFLVNIAEVPGTARLVDLVGCTAQAAPGIPAWLDCGYPGRAQQVTVEVRLRDGRTYSTRLPVVRIGRRPHAASGAVSPQRRPG